MWLGSCRLSRTDPAPLFRVVMPDSLQGRTFVRGAGWQWVADPSSRYYEASTATLPSSLLLLQNADPGGAVQWQYHEVPCNYQRLAFFGVSRRLSRVGPAARREQVQRPVHPPGCPYPAPAGLGAAHILAVQAQHQHCAIGGRRVGCEKIARASLT